MKWHKKLLLTASFFLTLNPLISVDAKELTVLTIRSSAQVNAGGQPIYRIINEKTNYKQDIQIKSKNGTDVRLENGHYSLQEIGTIKGFKPENPDKIYLDIPHYQEDGVKTDKIIIDFKSYKEKSEIKKPKEEKPVYKKPQEEKPEKWNPVELGERKPEKEAEKEPETEKPKDIIITENKKEPERKEPESEKEKVRKNPKTGDSLAVEAVLVSVILVSVAGIIAVLKKRKNDKR